MCLLLLLLLRELHVQHLHQIECKVLPEVRAIYPEARIFTGGPHIVIDVTLYCHYPHHRPGILIFIVLAVIVSVVAITPTIIPIRQQPGVHAGQTRKLCQ